MVNVTASVSNVYPGRWGSSIWTGADEAGSRYRFVANMGAMFRVPLIGETWAIQGREEKHPRYGEQVVVRSSSLLRPSGRLLVRFLTKHPELRGTGVGVARASRLYEQFGTALVDVLDDAQIAKLAGILPEDCAKKLIAAWQKVRHETAALQWLSAYGFDGRLSDKLLAIYGDQLIAKLHDNPYRMLAFASWKATDNAGLSLGVPLEDSRRQIAVVEQCLYRRLNDKHTLTEVSQLRTDIEGFFPRSGSPFAENAIAAALKAHAIVVRPDGCQPIGVHLMERAIEGRFRSLLLTDERADKGLFDDLHMQESIERALAAFEMAAQQTLTAEQRRAVSMGVTKPLSVISGGAGVGKTTVLRALCFVLKQFAASVRLMALSGRAASNLREATGEAATTIEAFLQASKTDRSPSLVVIDESSMLDVPLMYRIVKALPARVRILLVGDPHQLPPIGFGLIFQRLCGAAATPKTELTQVFRQSDATGIPGVALSIRTGELPALRQFEGQHDGVAFVRSSRADLLSAVMDASAALKGDSEVQILCATKSREAGVAAINVAYHDILSVGRRTLWGFAEGEPLIFLENDYKRGLWNGSLGLLTSIGQTPEGVDVLNCTFEGEAHELTETDLPRVQLAHAITIHKAQGSQFSRVIVPVVGSRLLDRQLLYTALTRATRQVVFVGDQDAFAAAIKAVPRAQERMVGFRV